MKAKPGRALGWFSLALGLTQLVAPAQLSRLIGVRKHEGLMRALGLRELMAAGAILLRSDPRLGLWSRVMGDLMDVALLVRGLGGRKAQRSRVAGATGLVIAITALDIVRARRPDGH